MKSSAHLSGSTKGAILPDQYRTAKGTNMTMRVRKHIDLTVVTFDSRSDFESTRARFDERVPLLDPSVTATS